MEIVENRQIEDLQAVKTATPLVLTPNEISAMLERRTAFQITKFRTTCSDCVPNL